MKKEDLKELKLRLLYLKYARKLYFEVLDSFEEFKADEEIVMSYLEMLHSNKGIYTFDNYPYRKYKKENLEERDRERRKNNPTESEKNYDFLKSLLEQAKNQDKILEGMLDEVLRKSFYLSLFSDQKAPVMTLEVFQDIDGTKKYYFRTYYGRNMTDLRSFIEIIVNKDDKIKRIEQFSRFFPTPRGPRTPEHVIIEDFNLSGEDKCSKEKTYVK